MNRLALSIASTILLVLLSNSTWADSMMSADLNEQQMRGLISQMLVHSPYRMSGPARAGKIRYVLEQTNPDMAGWQWPQTAEQRVSVQGDSIEVTVCRDCGEEPPPTAAMLARMSRSNPWVDSDSHAVIAFARAHASGRNVANQMQRLVSAVQLEMSGAIQFVGYRSASSALQTRSGDCTEYAVLLAAAARARGIPVRLAYGLAYSSRFTGVSHVFGPHAWVQAWDGKRWTSYDAGLERFDAGHIALFVSDGSADGLTDVTRVIRSLRIVNAVSVQPAR